MRPNRTLVTASKSQGCRFRTRRELGTGNVRPGLTRAHQAVMDRPSDKRRAFTEMAITNFRFTGSDSLAAMGKAMSSIHRVSLRWACALLWTPFSVHGKRCNSLSQGNLPLSFAPALSRVPPTGASLIESSDAFTALHWAASACLLLLLLNDPGNHGARSCGYTERSHSLLVLPAKLQPASCQLEPPVVSLHPNRIKSHGCVQDLHAVRSGGRRARG